MAEKLHPGREYKWVGNAGRTVEMGKLLSINERGLCLWENGETTHQDGRFEEVRKGLFGGRR